MTIAGDSKLARCLDPLQMRPRRTVAHTDELLAIDAEARIENLGHATRNALRQQKAPVLDRIRQQLEASKLEALPASVLGSRSGRDSSIIPSWSYPTTRPMNSMRPVASEGQPPTSLAHRLGLILSIVETGRRIKIPVREFLASVLRGRTNVSIQRITELTTMPGQRIKINPLNSLTTPHIPRIVNRAIGLTHTDQLSNNQDKQRDQVNDE